MSTTPQRLPGGGPWRVLHSLWLLVPVLTCGLLGGLGFLYVWARVRTRPFALGALFGVVSSTAIWVLSSIRDSSGQIADIPMGLALAVMAAQFAYGVVLNGKYLRWHAERSAAPAYAHMPPPAPAPRPMASDPISDLQARLEALASQVHTRRALPQDVLASLDRIFGRIREILVRSRSLSTNPDHLHLVDRIVTDYVPTSLNAYAALPPGYATTSTLASGRTPHTELLHQLDVVQQQLVEIANAAYAGDAAKLEAQGRFLDDRFRRSELDLS